MKRFLLQRLRITRFKIWVAKLLYLATRMIFQDRQRISRGGINFDIDLNEGIELHLFLFGTFQKHIIENEVIHIPPDGIILDVGANTGIMTLFFASKVPDGMVHSFEPTDYAFSKLKKNLRLNPSLQDRISINQVFVSSANLGEHDLSAHSSWPLTGHHRKHSVHGGVVMPAGNVPSITLDAYCQQHSIHRVSLVKIDTDGHEQEVLQGMRNIMKSFRPPIIFEIGLYIMEERGISFGEYTRFFDQFNYQLKTTRAQTVTLNNHLDFIPKYGTIDLIAIPR